MKRVAVSMALVLVLSLGVFAQISATVLLPDGKGAPMAEVIVGDQTFVADGQGKVQLPSGTSKALVKWLGLEQEMTVGATMKFSNKVLYGPPYDEFDWIRPSGDNWQFDEDAISYTKKGEGQALLDDEFDDFVLRARFVIWETSQWNYLRFMFRLPQPGWNGYGLSIASYGNDISTFFRFDGNWDKYAQLTPTLGLDFRFQPAEEYEVVIFAKDTHMAGYVRQVGGSYVQIFSVEDDSPQAYSFGTIAIMNSSTISEVTDFAIYQL